MLEDGDMKDVLENILNELKKDTISPEAEYNALRAEKIYRYGYANSVNTALLTLTLAVFSVGGLLFTSSNNTFEGIAEIFFPLFFLIPCLFARIGFRSLVKNSVRIGVLSEYMRKHLFKGQRSWECIKNDKFNYFMETKKYIGGVKEVPQCVSIISILFSAIIGYHPIYVLIEDKINAVVFLIICLLIIGIAYFLRQHIKFSNLYIAIAVASIIVIIVGFFIATVAMYCFCNMCAQTACNFLKKLILYFVPYIIAILLMPNFEKEIEDANTKLDDYKKMIAVNES